MPRLRYDKTCLIRSKVDRLACDLHLYILANHNGSRNAVFSRCDAGKLRRSPYRSSVAVRAKLLFLSQAQAKDLTSRTTFNPVKAALPRRSAQTLRFVTCSAQTQVASRPVQTVLAATALAAAIGLGSVDAARADISGLTPCAESKQFAKRQKTEVKTLQRRLKNVRVSQCEQLSALYILRIAQVCATL